MSVAHYSSERASFGLFGPPDMEIDLKKAPLKSVTSEKLTDCRVNEPMSLQ